MAAQRNNGASAARNDHALAHATINLIDSFPALAPGDLGRAPLTYAQKNSERLASLIWRNNSRSRRRRRQMSWKMRRSLSHQFDISTGEKNKQTNKQTNEWKKSYESLGSPLTEKKCIFSPPSCQKVVASCD